MIVSRARVTLGPAMGNGGEGELTGVAGSPTRAVEEDRDGDSSELALVEPDGPVNHSIGPR